MLTINPNPNPLPDNLSLWFCPEGFDFQAFIGHFPDGRLLAGILPGHDKIARDREKEAENAAVEELQGQLIRAFLSQLFGRNVILRSYDGIGPLRGGRCSS